MYGSVKCWAMIMNKGLKEVLSCVLGGRKPVSLVDSQMRLVFLLEGYL